MTIQSGLPEDETSYDVCVVGAGPLGIAVARECEALGLSVILLESGGVDQGGSAALAPYGEVADTKRHAPLEVAVCRALGGSTWWWGGRCLPLDQIDYEHRDFVADSGWPLSAADLRPFEIKAAEYLDCGSNSFVKPNAAWMHLGYGVNFSSVERWSRTRELAKHHTPNLAASGRIRVCLNTSVVSIVDVGGLVTAVLAVDRHGEHSIAAGCFVLACGGLGTTKLLQLYQRTHPMAFGGRTGALGRYYMGHLSGQIADIVLSDPGEAEVADFFLDETRTWIRRRFTIDAEMQRERQILNTAFWVNNAPFYDPRHGSGILSAVYLALSIPVAGRRLVAEGIRRMHVGAGGNYMRHIVNVLRDPLDTVFWTLQILKQRYVERPRRPGFLIRNKAGRYALTYHSEQTGSHGSAAVIQASSASGMSDTLWIDLRFSRSDAESVVRAHEIVDEALRHSGKGRLDYHHPPQDRIHSVLAQASDGYHQEGLLRMGIDPESSVVDSRCKVHGFANLYVASTGVFPTSGQANPTFTACALAIRLAHHLAAVH